LRWEQPIPLCRYLISVDTKENSEIIKETGELGCNAVLVWRDKYQDVRNVWHAAKLVTRVKA
jgi:hypothetical protein